MSKVIKVFSFVLAIILAAPLFSQKAPDVRKVEVGESLNMSKCTSLAYDSANNRYLRVFIGCPNYSDMCYYSEDYYVYGMIIDHDGSIVCPRFPISRSQNFTDLFMWSYPDLSCDVGFDHVNQRFLVVWPDYHEGSAGVYGQFVDTNGNLIGAGAEGTSNFRINDTEGFSKVVDLAFDSKSQHFLVSWDYQSKIVESKPLPDDLRKAVFARLVNSRKPFSPIAGSREISFASPSAYQAHPAVAFDEHHMNYLVVWQDQDFRKATSSDVLDHTIKGQMLNRSGEKIGERGFVIKDYYGNRYLGEPEVAWESRSNRFVVVWVQNGTPSQRGIYTKFVCGKIVNPNGTMYAMPGNDGEFFADTCSWVVNSNGDCFPCLSKDPNVVFDPVRGDFVILFSYEPLGYTLRVDPNGIITEGLKRIAEHGFFRVGSSKQGLAYNSRCGNIMMSFSSMDPNYFPHDWFLGDNQCPGMAVVKMVSIDNITGCGAVCKGEVKIDCGLDVTARGMCWSTEPGPDLSGSHTTDGKGMGYFKSVLTGLLPDTKYYVRAYATNSAGTVFGGERTFTTKAAFNVVFKPENGGSLLGVSSQEVLPGGTCSPVKAVASEGFFFIGWQGDGGFGSSFENPLVVRNVTGNMNIMARFNPIALRGERIAARDRALKNDIVEIDISCNPVDASLPLVFKLYRSIDGVGRQLVGQFSSADLADGHHHVLDEGLTSGRRYEYTVDVFNHQAEKVGESTVLVL